MRIHSFDLAAFGPFTNKMLEFPQTGTDLHIIYGPNEAGKSSSLRALKAWLFGFPERTSDDFLHPRNQLLVGGEIWADKKRLVFYRRKKRKGDLVDPDGNLIDPAGLAYFLKGLDLPLFESLYGIDHDSLVRGGREILARHGEIGEALFSAGAGLDSLHRVLVAMEEEKNALFKKQGRKPVINKAVSLQKKLKKQIRALSLPPERWQELAEKLAQANRELDEMGRKRSILDRQYRQLERLRQAIPLLTRKKNLQEQQTHLGDVPALPTDFSTIRSTVQQQLRSSRQQLEQAKARKKLLTKRLDQLSLNTQLVKHFALVEDLFQRLGAYRKAKKDQPRLEGMRSVHLKEAGRLLRSVSPGLELAQSDQLLPLIQQKRRILALLSRQEALELARQDSTTRLMTARSKLEKTKRLLADIKRPADSSGIKMAVEHGRRAGDIDKRIRQAREKCSAKNGKIRLALKQMGRLRGDIGTLIELELPLSETIHLFRDELQTLQLQQEQLVTEARQMEEELRTLGTRRQELIYGGDIPSEEELHEVRSRRNRGWQLLCRNWLEQEDISSEIDKYAAGKELHETVFSLIMQADTLSDRLRLEADRVHDFAALQARTEELKSLLQKNTRRQREIAKKLSLHEKSWGKVWKPLNIEPALPAEMADWRTGIAQLQQLALDHQEKRNHLAVLERERESLLEELRAALDEKKLPVAGNGNLESVLLLAETRLENLLQQQEKYLQLDRDKDNLQEQVKQVEQVLEQVNNDLDRWQQNWHRAACIPGTAEPFAPDLAQDILENTDRILSTLKEAGEFESRLQGIDRDCTKFEDEVRELVNKLAPDLIDQPAGRCVTRLHEDLVDSRKTLALFEKYTEESREANLEIQQAEMIFADAEREIKRLFALAGCSSEEELVPVEQKASEHRQLVEQIGQIEQDLQQVAGDISLAELVKQAQTTECDGLPGELQALKQQITTELDPGIEALAVRKGEIQKELEQMDGGAKAADKAEEFESNLAQLRYHAGQYLRLQVGVDMLNRELESFRRRNQDPVLTIGSQLFAELTLGSFSGLKTDLDDRGEPILVGIRKETGQTIGVEAMSTGSRDQLYLALRLASLQHRAENGQSMPFIVDDILINFDDKRSTATLKVLAELAGTNQLILFTHQRQVALQAENIAGVEVHHLEH